MSGHWRPRWIIPEAHDPKTCPICAPALARKAYWDGVERARRTAETKDDE